MPDDSPILALPYIQPAQAQKHVTHNEALRLLDILVQAVVEDRSLTVPPEAPAPGSRHVVAPGATGAWAGQDNKIAISENGGWFFLTPRPGWSVQVLSEGREIVFDGAGWTSLADRLVEVAALGVSAVPDATNRLSVNSPATLLNHVGAGHQVKVNKATASDTASLLFQSGFSGRAEMGLMGEDAFSIKVSADGSGWKTLLGVEAGAGVAVFPNGAKVNGLLSGEAVTQGFSDMTSGRLMKVGDFGLGAAAVSASDFNGLMASGIYSGDSSTSNRPGGTGNWLLLHLARLPGASDPATQIAISRASGTAGAIWTRARNDAGVWSGWQLVYGQKSLVGPVSQAAGAPTGAAMERGANANGEYLRLADGTQICSVSLSATSSAGATVWTFPASFAVAPVVSVIGQGAVPLVPTLESVTAMAASLSVYSLAGSRQSVPAHVTAVGRWF